MITCAVGRQALVQGARGVLEQLRRATFDLWRLSALGAKRFYDRRAFVGGDFGRGLAGQVANVPGLVAFAGFWLGGEAGDVSGYVPALAVVQLVGKGRHLGAIDAQGQGVVEVEQAQLVEARDIAQVGGCRLKAHAGRAIASAGVAVADRTVLRVQRSAAGRVRGNHRSLADLIGHRQTSAQLAGLFGDSRAVLTLVDGVAQRLDALLQSSLLGVCRQAFDQLGQYRAELLLLAVFAIVDDLAVLYGRRVVGANVVQQVQGLGGLGGGLGLRQGAAQRQHRAEQYNRQPGKQTGTGFHGQSRRECEREHCSLPLSFAQGCRADFMKNLATNQMKRGNALNLWEILSCVACPQVLHMA